ncbi:hypothetical protein [uncultured Shimia sp.]|uniref:hypothetical protein n=1 Tax=uncultured Shimia sp. TaxID=573152 RepID=UPI0026329F2A|nr:hypothetical protein [uncultured Shimia sp.]
MRVFLTGCAVLALAACQPKIPDSAAGVGFDNAILSPQSQPAASNAAVPPPASVSQETLATPAPAPVVAPASTAAASTTSSQPMATTATAVPPPKPVAQPTSTATRTATNTTATDPTAPTSRSTGAPQTTTDGVVHASPSNPAPVLMNNPGISDENDFEAVGSRRSIEADAARTANNRANYEVIEPTAVPKRTNTGPNIVAYALSTNHAVGTKAYSRMGLTSQSRHQKACAKFGSGSDAQTEFLSRGGPKKDRLGLDPDGDGFACNWDPTPYRQAARN